MPDTDTSETPDTRPHVISLCGTYLKPEMQSIYRQITGVQRVRTTVYAQWLENENLFPFERIRLLTKQHHRAKGNFLLRFWYKHIVKQWPPPREINKHVGPCHPWDLVERLQEDKPDLVHVYYGHKAVGYLPMLRDWGGPWIVSFHGVDVAKHLEEGDYLKKLRQVFAEARLVLARSESLLNRLHELGCPPEKLRLNRTPIPMDHLPAFAREVPANGHWRLIQACRLIAKKGIITTLEAMDRVGAIFPGARYILCGSGPMMEEIQAYVKEHALERHAEIRGWMSQEALRAELYQAHVFLHASEQTQENDQEGIPNSMLEAMATGLPVVATLHGGIPEAVTSGYDGLLVPERNAHELSTAITKLLQDHALFAELGHNAATSVRANFGAEQQIAALEDHYLEAIASAHEAAEPTA